MILPKDSNSKDFNFANYLSIIYSISIISNMENRNRDKNTMLLLAERI